MANGQAAGWCWFSFACCLRPLSLALGNSAKQLKPQSTKSLCSALAQWVCGQPLRTANKKGRLMLLNRPDSAERAIKPLADFRPFLQNANRCEYPYCMCRNGFQPHHSTNTA